MGKTKNTMKEKPYQLSMILLAAGNSKRFQGNKLLSMIEGKPMYLHLIDKIHDIPAYQKVIVTQYQEIIDYVKDSNYDHSVKAIKNDHSEWGISYSIQLGMEYCNQIEVPELDSSEKELQAYMFAVCDQPWLTQKSIEKLIDVFINSEKSIACLSYDGNLGNPVIFDETYYKELKSLTGDVGGKSIIKRHREDVVVVEVDDPIELMDVDVPIG